MKIKKSFLLVIFSFLTMSSCGILPAANNNSIDKLDSSSINDRKSEEQKTHEHTFDNVWSYDDQYHWHGSTCGHDVTSHKEEHTFNEYVTPPTYEKNGYTVYICSTCGYTYVDNEINKLEHTYSQIWDYDESTHWHQCIDEGYENLKKDVTQHQFEEQVIASTYDSMGYSVFTCTTCGYSYRGNETEKKKHNYASTWSSNEFRHWQQCIDEGYESLITNSENHSFLQSEFVEATYDAPGYIINRCEVCGYENRTDLAILEHIYNDYYDFDETHHWHSCYDQGYENLNQDYEEHVIVEKERFDSNFYSNGWVKYGCEKCPYEYEEELPIKEHQYAEEWSSDWQYHWHTCIDKDFENLYIDQESHDFGDWIIDSPATEDSDGSQHRTCSVCEYEQKQDIKLLGSLDKIKFEKMIVDGRNGIYVSAISTDIEGRVVIPGYYNNEVVYGVAPHGFENCTKITSIDCKIDRFSIVGECGFLNCTNLESYDLASQGNVEIMSEAFKNCSSLKEFTFGSQGNIYDNAFENCTSLETVTFGWTCQHISTYVFKNCTSLKNVTLSTTATYIPVGMFEGCTSLKEITIPEDVSIISKDAFSGCTYLETITFETKVLKEIESSAFEGCSNLSNINLPSSIEEVGIDAFKECTSLNKQAYGNGLYLGNEDNRYLVLIDLVDETNNYLYIHDDCRIVGSNKMSYNTSLNEVIIGSGLTKIVDQMFIGDPNLSSITIKEGIEEIGQYAFCECKLLSSLIIPNSVKTVKNGAFENCSSLKTISFGDGLSSLEITSATFVDCSALESVNVNENNPYYCSMDGVLFSKNKETIFKYPANKNDEKYLLLDSITKINDCAFLGATNLKEITLNQKVTTIKRNAFEGCINLEVIDLKNEPLEEIQDGAFYGCSKLRTIEMADTVTKVGMQAFAHCNNLENITLSNNITALEPETFIGCSKLANVTIPESVKTIERWVFQYCDSLKTLNWDAINVAYVDPDAFPCSFTTVVFGKKVESIPAGAFKNNNSIGYIDIYGNIKSIGAEAFYNNTINTVTFYNTFAQWFDIDFDSPITNKNNSIYQYFRVEPVYGEDYIAFMQLQNIVLPESVTSIGDYQLCGVSYFVNLTIHHDLTHIGTGALSYCIHLEEITYQGTMQEWEAIEKGDNWYEGSTNLSVVHCLDGDITLQN